MDLGLKNKTAIILASSKGLGKAAAFSLAKEGCRIAICARSEKNLQNTVDQIRHTANTEVHSAAFDVKNKNDLESFIKDTN